MSGPMTSWMPSTKLAGDPFQLAGAELGRVDGDAPLGAAEGNVDHGRLPGHQRGQRADFAQVDFRVIAQPALHRARGRRRAARDSRSSVAISPLSISTAICTETSRLAASSSWRMFSLRSIRSAARSKYRRVASMARIGAFGEPPRHGLDCAKPRSQRMLAFRELNGLATGPVARLPPAVRGRRAGRVRPRGMRLAYSPTSIVRKADAARFAGKKPSRASRHLGCRMGTGAPDFRLRAELDHSPRLSGSQGESETGCSKAAVGTIDRQPAFVDGHSDGARFGRVKHAAAARAVGRGDAFRPVAHAAADDGPFG